LTKVDLDSAVIDEGIVHLEVGLAALLLGRKLHKGIAEGVPRLRIANDLRPRTGIEAREYQLQIFVVRDRIELANEQDIIRGGNVGRGQIAQHLQHHGPALVFLLAEDFLPFLGGYSIVLLGEGDIGSDPPLDAFLRRSFPRWRRHCQPRRRRRCRRRIIIDRLLRFPQHHPPRRQHVVQPFGIIERIVQHVAPNNPHIGVGPSIRIAVQPIDLVQYAVVVFHHHAHAVVSPTTTAAALPVQSPSIAGIAAPIHGQQQLRPQGISHPIHLGHDQPPLLEQLRRRQLPRLPRAVARLEEPPARRRHVPVVGLYRIDQTVDGRAAGAIAAGIAELT